jgi:predicted permease
MIEFPNYLDAFQTIIVQFLIVVLGYIFMAVGFFTYDESVPFFRILRLVSLPAIVFRELSIVPMTWSSFAPLAHSILTQATIHILSALAAFFIPAPDHFTQFLTFIYSYSHTCFIPYGYPIIRILFGENLCYIPIVANIIQTLITRPLHIWATFHISPLAVTHDFIPDAAAARDSAAHDSPRPSESVRSSRKSTSNVGTPDIEAVLDNGESQAPLEEVDTDPDDTESEEPVVIHDFKRNMIGAFVAGSIIAIVLGIVWNIIGVKLPLVLQVVADNFSHAYCGCTMFCIGVAARNHPLNVGQWSQVVPFLAVHHIANPLIALAWAFALRLDAVTARACVLLWSMPVEWTGAWLVERCGSPRNVITATALWSHIIALPMFFCWLALLGETHPFG